MLNKHAPPKVFYKICNEAIGSKSPNSSNISSGSCKINNNCTCTMKITKHVDKTVTADACFTHYGHSKNIGYTWISQKKKTEWNCCQITTRCLQRKNTKILDDIRNNVGTEFLRDHIINKKDVINIQRAYGLEEVQTIKHVSSPGSKNSKTPPAILLSGTNYKVSSFNDILRNSKCLQIYIQVYWLFSILFVEIY